MKYTTVLVIIMSIFLISCYSVDANNKVKIDTNFYFNSKNAYNYVKAQTDLGPRTYGSEAHQKVREFFKDEMSNMGYEVFSHSFNAPFIENRVGENIYAFLNSTNSMKKDSYIVIASHFDSRSVAEKDPINENRRKAIDGANDGASSSGVLLELMNTLKNYNLEYNICFILFDLEDDGGLFYLDSSPHLIDTDWIQGSIAFVDNNILDYSKIKFGILLDMVGYRGAKFKFESYSYSYFSSLYNKVWEYANLLGYSNYFVNDYHGVITDDHIPFVLKGVPFIDIIDMGYPYHHTIQDTIDKIDISTLDAVGKTVEYVVRNVDLME